MAPIYIDFRCKSLCERSRCGEVWTFVSQWGLAIIFFMQLFLLVNYWILGIIIVRMLVLLM